ncbi:MAG: NAD(P)-dependent oxidoreductase [Sphingomonas sp.]
MPLDDAPLMLSIARIPADLRDGIDAECGVRTHLLEGEGPAAFTALPGGFSALLTRAVYGVPPEVMAAMPNLRLIVSLGAGLDKIDLSEAARRGIAVAHTPDELTEDVAEFAIAAIFAVQRRLMAGDAFVRSGRWTGPGYGLSQRISGSRVGIIGLGRIGQRIALKAGALGATVGYHSQRERPESPFRFYSHAATLAAESDILVLACAGNVSTEKLVDAGVLEALGPSGILVNVARGSVVDEEALIGALQNGRIAGAALDVFVGEPDIDPRLLALDNVLLSPHAASLTVQARQALIGRLVASTRAFSRGEPFPDAAAPHRPD